jgi:Fe-S-cluster-containing hydrogenase component 2
MVKCDLCQGEEIPACVANCPNEALIYADKESEGQQEGKKIITVVK